MCGTEGKGGASSPPRGSESRWREYCRRITSVSSHGGQKHSPQVEKKIERTLFGFGEGKRYAMGV